MSIMPTGRPSASTTGSSLILRSAMMATASSIIEPCGTVQRSGGHHFADRPVERRVALVLEQPRQIAVGKQPGQLARRVDQHDRAGAAAGAAVFDEHLRARVCDSAPRGTRPAAA